jgi:hypothetical protein
MKHRSAFVLITVLVLASASAGAQRKIQIPNWEKAVTFEVLSSQEPVRPGDSFELAVVAAIEEGYHLYGPDEPEPTRTRITVVGDTLRSPKTVYPPPIRRELSGLGEYDLYEGEVVVRVPVTLAKTHTASTVPASLKVEYQLCTDFACSAPTSKMLELELTGAKAGSAVKQLRPDVFSKK